MNNVVKLEPFYKEAIWGIEHWLISTHENGKSLVDGAELPFDIPYLIKKISTHKDLSVQVHPSDVNSKNESWLITGHEDGAGIYLGFKEGVSKFSFELALKNSEDISSFLNYIPVKKGDFFFIPAGAIHAIGKDIELIEVQECSDTTYRVWDWNRNGLDGKPRELHINEAFSCLDYSFNKPDRINIEDVESRKEEILSFKGITIELLSLAKGESLSFSCDFKTSFILLSGEVALNNQTLGLQNSYLTLSDCDLSLKAHHNSKVLSIRYTYE